MAEPTWRELQHVVDQVSDHMSAILGHFKGGAKITVLVRSPEATDGSRDFVLTNDTLDQAIAALQQRRADADRAAKAAGARDG